MYIDIVPNRKSPPAILLRESVRQGKIIRKRTLANLSGLSLAQAEAIRLILKGHPVAPVELVCTIARSLHQGQVQAVQEAMNRLGFTALGASRRSRQRDVVIALVVARLLQPESKLATTRW
jgi:hypothetical protein